MLQWPLMNFSACLGLQLAIIIIKQMSSLNDFEVLSQIGEGMYSTVFKVRRLEDNATYALKQVKLIDMPTKEVSNAINEVRILASIRHPNVIGYKEAFYDHYSKTLCIVMEYADAGDLEQKITEHRNRGQYFKENEIWDLFGQMLCGLARLHDLGILHRDVKSANFYLTRSGSVKIGDMNVSKVIRKTGMCETQTGAPYYASPEVWKEEAYDAKSDMWSLGCVLYEIINLKLPFKARDMEGLFKKVTRGYYPRINKSYSDDLSEVLKLLINVNPKDRKFCRELLEMPMVRRNIKKQRESELEQKSILLRTIKLNKNLSYVGSSLPKPNYSPLKYKYSSLSHSMIESPQRSQQVRASNSSAKMEKLDHSLKLSLPPLSGPSLAKPDKVYRYEPPESPGRKISSEKTNPRHKRARSYMRS